MGLRERMTWLLSRVHEPRPRVVPDPWAVLRVQLRLGALAHELRVLRSGSSVYARVRRLRAAEAAYDDLLLEACRLAVVPVPRSWRADEQQRTSLEVELVSRGWSW
jgi:hypothetical protein